MKIIRNQGTIKGRNAFTLIELIAVIAVIAILMGIGASTLKNVTSARGVGTAVPIAESLFSEARSVAKGRGVDAYVVIYADSSNTEKGMKEKYLRYMGVATAKQKLDSSGDPIPNESEITLTGKGTVLPSKVFFNPKTSGFTGGPNGKAFIPGVSGESDCYVYRFNSEGILVDPVQTGGADEPQAKFVVQRAVLTPGSDTPKVPKDAKRDIGGFAVWRSGATSLFRTADQITTGDSDF